MMFFRADYLNYHVENRTYITFHIKFSTASCFIHITDFAKKNAEIVPMNIGRARFWLLRNSKANGPDVPTTPCMIPPTNPTGKLERTATLSVIENRGSSNRRIR